MEVIIGGKSLGDATSQAGDLLLPAHPDGAGGWEAKGLLNLLVENHCCPQLQSGSAGSSHKLGLARAGSRREVFEATIGRLHAVSTVGYMAVSVVVSTHIQFDFQFHGLQLTRKLIWKINPWHNVQLNECILAELP